MDNLKVRLIIFFIINTVLCFSQKAKSSVVYSNTYSIPKTYIPNKYKSYYSQITLPKKPIQINVNGVYNSDHLKIEFNTFFKEGLYENLFSSIEGLVKEKESDNADLIINALIKNPNINIIIKKEKPFMDYKGRSYETPHTYSYTYGFEIEFKINSQKEKKNIFYKKINSTSKYRVNVKDRIVAFEKEEDAIKYAVKLINKTIITGELYKGLMGSLGGKSVLKSELQFSNYNDFYYLYKVSRKKKHNKIELLNNYVDLFKSDLKAISKNTYKKTKNDKNDNFKSQLLYENDEKVKAYKLASSKKYNIKLINRVLKFEKSMNLINDFSNPETKAEKAIAWSALINNAHVFFMIGDFNKSLN
jgi:hypothetical protein